MSGCWLAAGDLVARMHHQAVQRQLVQESEMTRALQLLQSYRGFKVILISFYVKADIRGSDLDKCSSWPDQEAIQEEFLCEVSHKSPWILLSRNTRLNSQGDQAWDGANIITHHHQLQILDNLSGIQRSQERDNEPRSGDLYQEIIEGASGHLRISDMARQTKEDFPQ